MESVEVVPATKKNYELLCRQSDPNGNRHVKGTHLGAEYCGTREHHEYQLYLAVEDIDHSKTMTRIPQSNGICERFHKTVLREFYQVAFPKKIYNIPDELQVDLDNRLDEYNKSRLHSGVKGRLNPATMGALKTSHFERQKICF